MLSPRAFVARGRAEGRFADWVFGPEIKHGPACFH